MTGMSDCAKRPLAAKERKVSTSDMICFRAISRYVAKPSPDFMVERSRACLFEVEFGGKRISWTRGVAWRAEDQEFARGCRLLLFDAVVFATVKPSNNGTGNPNDNAAGKGEFWTLKAETILFMVML